MGVGRILAPAAALGALILGVAPPAAAIGCDETSLRNAIDSANLASITITILMPPNCQVQLTQTLPDIRKAMIIEGYGSRIWRDWANENTAAFRLFWVDVHGSLELRNLTLEGGKGHAGFNGSGADAENSAGPGGPGWDGGAIQNLGSLTLDHVTLIHNEGGQGGEGGACWEGVFNSRGGGWGGNGGRGGAVFNGGTLEIRHSTFAHNKAGTGGEGGSCSDNVPDYRGGAGGLGGGGGAIWSEPDQDVRIYWSTFFDNGAGLGGEPGTDGYEHYGTGGHGGIGGGVVSQGHLIVEDSTLEANYAGDGGSNNFDSSRAGGDGGDGGALVMLSGWFEIRRSTFSWNIGGAPGHGGLPSTGTYGTPGDGGAIWADLSAGTESLIESSTIASNRANAEDACNGGGNGGGLHLTSGNMTLRNATFAGNSPGIGRRSLFCLLGDAGFGTAIYNAGGHVTFGNSLFDETSRLDGGKVPETCGGAGTYTNGTPNTNIVFSFGWYNGCPGNNLANDPLLGTIEQNATTGNGHTPGNAPPSLVPEADSDAIDRGSNGSPSPCAPLDIRGLSRPQGPNCDIGAYEVDHGRVIEDPDDVTVDAPASASFTAKFSAGTDASLVGTPQAKWQMSTNGGGNWTDVTTLAELTADQAGDYPTAYTRTPTASAEDGALFRALFVTDLNTGIPTGNAELTVRFIDITRDLPTTVNVNVGDLFALSYEYAANPAVTGIAWQYNDGLHGWSPTADPPPTPGTGGEIVLPRIAALSQNGWLYKSVLTGGYPGRPSRETGTAQLQVTDLPSRPSFGANAANNVVTEEGTEARFTVTVAAGNPVPSLGWQMAPGGGSFTPLTNGDLSNPDHFHFNTFPNLAYQAALWFRAYGDQDTAQFAATATNASGSASSPPGRLIVQVPTSVGISCPADLVHGFEHICHVSVTANPLRGPRPRKPCGQVLVERVAAGRIVESHRCTLDPNATCDVTFGYPGDNAPPIPHHVSYLGGGTAPCEAGGIIPPDLASDETFDVTITSCSAPTITTCPAGRSVDLAGSCTAPVPDFLPSVSVNDPGCEVTLSQDPAPGTLLAAGAHDVTITARTDEGSDTCTTTFTVRDVTPPSLQLNGVSPVTVECHTSYTDLGATAQDCSGTPAVTSSGTVNVNAVGRYTITYEATDASLNRGTATRTVDVVDTTRPVVTVNGPTSLTIECHTTFTDPGATANDTCAGSLTASPSGNVDANTPGVYTITYTATDPAGNTGTAQLRVTVQDTTPPDLTCPAAPAPASADASCRAPVPNLASLATATDNCSAPGAITITQSPAAGTLVGVGPHMITITARDAAGRESTCTRSFSVVDTTNPTISCPANITVVVPAGSCEAAVTFAATPADNCGTPTVTYTKQPGSLFPLGKTTVTATARDAAGNTAQCSFDVTVLPFTATTSVTSPTTRQYSDRVTLTATVVPAAAASGNVAFFVGTQSLGTAPLGVTGTATLANVALLESPALPSNGQMAPGNRTVTAVFTPSSSCYLTPNATAPLAITKENAWAEFTGDSFYSICPTCTSATVTFVALVKDITAVPADPSTDGNPGVIQNASVTFVNPANSAPYCTAPVGVVNAGDTQTGLASCTKQIALGTCAGEPCSSITIDVGIQVGSYYDRAAAFGDAVITVSQNLQTGMVTGGGHLVLASSAGRLAGDSGRKSNYGFNIKYNKKYTNLQGGVNTIIRRLESDGVVHLYQVKGNAMQSLTVDLVTTGAHPFPTAIFTGKATIQDVTNPLAPVAIDGGATFRLSMTDKGEPGKNDMLGVSVFAAQNKGGGLWFSSSWNGTETAEQVIAGGNLSVR